MKTYIIYIMIFLIGFLLTAIVTAAQAGRRDQGALKERLSYLKDIPEISWIVIVKNNVYLGFNKKINDMGAICRGAALNGNRAYGFGVHVYAVDGHQADWRKAKHYCRATARRGKVTRSNCK